MTLSSVALRYQLGLALQAGSLTDFIKALADSTAASHVRNLV
jgi:hypothetical protein